MSCALLVRGDEGYGVSRILQDIAWELLRRGESVIAFSAGKGSLYDALRQLGVETIVYRSRPPRILSGTTAGKLMSLSGMAFEQFQRSRWLAKNMRERSITRLILRNPLDVVLAGLACRSSSTQAVWLMPNAVSSSYPLDINRHIYHFAFSLLPVKPRANSAYTLSTLGRAVKHGRVTHLGIRSDPEYLSRGDCGTFSLKAEEEDVMFGIFARLVPEKGQLLFLRALQSFRPGLEKMSVVLCGGPLCSDYAREIHDFVEKNGLDARVHLLGHQDAPGPLYDLCDIVVNARTDPEPFGLSIIEAMHRGKPVLAHRAGGPGEIVQPGRTGWLADAANLPGFEQAIQQVYRDRRLWSEMGKAAKVVAAEKFTLTRMVDELLAV